MKNVFKASFIALVLTLTACGTDSKDESPTLARSYYADLTAANPSASIGEAGCAMDITLAEVEAGTDSINAGGQVIPYAYDTKDGRFFVLIEATGTKSVQFFKDFVRASVVCK